MNSIRKGDTIEVRAGKDKGKRAKVLHFFPQDGRITAENVNLVTKHRRPRRANEKGQTVHVPSPFPVSRAGLVCPHCSKRTRIKFVVVSEKKERACKKCGRTIS